LTKLVQLTELHAALSSLCANTQKYSDVRQEGQPGTSKSPRGIARDTAMSHSSVRRIVKKDLNLKTFRRRVDELLGTDQPGIDRQSNRPVAGQNFVSDSGERRA